jgi:YfiH family protein
VLVDGVDLGDGIRAGFTSRRGGLSAVPFDTLNLGTAVGDDPSSVARNRALVDDWVGAPVVYATQVHGTGVVVLSEPAGVGEADALVSVSPGAPVGVLVADCVPVLLADASAGVVAAVHAGRRGLAAGVLQAAVDAMAGAGAEVERIRAATGPAISGRSYEVPAELRDEVADVVPETFATTSWGTPALDLPAGVGAVLRRLGVRVEFVSDRDTYTDGDLFSFRRSARTGRFGGVVRAPA